MPRRRFNAFEYYLNKIGMLEQILEKAPQCKNCEHLEFWSFVPECFVEKVSKEYCPSCPKYDGNEWEILTMDDIEIPDTEKYPKMGVL